MNFHAPERPTTAGGLPAYPFSAPIAALPQIQIFIEKSGWRIEILLALARNQFAHFRKYIPRSRTMDDVLGNILDDYEEDPEETMKNVFGWPGLKEEKPKPIYPIPPEDKVELINDIGF